MNWTAIMGNYLQAVTEYQTAYVSRGSVGAGNFSHVGSTPQISRAYSAMVRSLENLPLDAILWMDISNHFFWFCKNKQKGKKSILLSSFEVYSVTIK